jgi:hypothetical protein
MFARIAKSLTKSSDRENRQLPEQVSRCKLLRAFAVLFSLLIAVSTFPIPANAQSVREVNITLCSGSQFSGSSRLVKLFDVPVNVIDTGGGLGWYNASTSPQSHVLSLGSDSSFTKSVSASITGTVGASFFSLWSAQISAQIDGSVSWTNASNLATTATFKSVPGHSTAYAVPFHTYSLAEFVFIDTTAGCNSAYPNRMPWVEFMVALPAAAQETYYTNWTAPGPPGLTPSIPSGFTTITALTSDISNWNGSGTWGPMPTNVGIPWMGIFLQVNQTLTKWRNGTRRSVFGGSVASELPATNVQNPIVLIFKQSGLY